MVLPVQPFETNALPGAAGACTSSHGTIHLHREWLFQAPSEAVVAGADDAHGDDGAHVASLLAGEQPSPDQRGQLCLSFW